MDEETIIEVFEHREDEEHEYLGIVIVKGDVTYARTRVEIIEDDIFSEPFSFVYIQDKTLNTKQEGKWHVKDNKVYIKPGIDKRQKFSSKESCTGMENSSLTRGNENFEEKRPKRQIEDKILEDVVEKWEIACNKMRSKLRNLRVPRDDNFELKIEEFCGKPVIRLWCHECGKPYGLGSSDAKAANACINNFLRSHLKSIKHKKRYYARRGLIRLEESINHPKIDDEACIKSSLEVLKNFNESSNDVEFELIPKTLHGYKDKSLVKIKCKFDETWLPLCPPQNDLISILSQHMLSKTHLKAVESIKGHCMSVMTGSFRCSQKKHVHSSTTP